jgi:dTDP-4-amino-4,6-dideoxygalactose transaminase
LQHIAIRAELLDQIERVLDHGQFILGPEVYSFETSFAKYCGSPHAIGVDNGTSALILVLQALGIGPGDEVITAPNSFLASTSCIALVGARPIFVDVADDYNIDSNLIEKAVTPQTKAILPVHLTGRPANMAAVMEIAQKHRLFVIEDCAQAVGARYKGQHVGTFGDAGCFSLHPLKTLNALGDGGIIVTQNATLAERLRKARNHGLRNRDECEFWSDNCRLDTIQAAMLNVKMKYLDQWTTARRAIAATYLEQLRTYVETPEERDEEYAVYHTFVIQADRRDQLRDYLLKHGVQTKIHYPIPIHLQKSAEKLGYAKGSFPKTEEQSRRILSLPIYPELSSNQLSLIISSIQNFYQS